MARVGGVILSRPGFDQYQRSLSGIERRYMGDLNRLYRELRTDGLDIVERFGISSQSRSLITSLYKSFKAQAGRIGIKNVSEITAASHDFADRQNKLVELVDVTPQVSPTVTETVEEAAWVDAILADVLSKMTPYNEAENVDKQLFGLQKVNDRASAWRHGRNKMKTATILQIFGAGNVILNEIYKAMNATYRQAIAAIDERTTDCCLRVHGQIVRQDQDFTLTGTPRFARKIHFPPFHWYCRTAVTLYEPTLEEIGITTEEMEDAARAERKARKDRGRVEIHPAHATSRRP